MEHVHFDIDQAEKKIRADMEKTFTEGMRLAPDADSRELVRLQASLSDFTVAFARWDMARVNDACDEDIASDALGYTLGNLIFSFAANCEGDVLDNINQVMLSAGKAIGAGLYGGHEDAVSAFTSIPTMQGGRA